MHYFGIRRYTQSTIAYRILASISGITSSKLHFWELPTSDLHLMAFTSEWPNDSSKFRLLDIHKH